MARPKKLTPALFKPAYEAVKKGTTIERAVASIGISRRGWYRWLQRGEERERPCPRFDIATQQAEEAEALEALERINGAASTDWKAAAWLLERRHGDTRDQYERSCQRQEATEAEEPERTMDYYHSPEGLAELADSLRQIGPRLLGKVIQQSDYSRRMIEAAMADADQPNEAA